MKTKKRTGLVLLAMGAVLLCLATDAQAAGYLDSGAGSTVVQGIIASLAAVSRFFNKIKRLFTRAKQD